MLRILLVAAALLSAGCAEPALERGGPPGDAGSGNAAEPPAAGVDTPPPAGSPPIRPDQPASLPGTSLPGGSGDDALAPDPAGMHPRVRELVERVGAGVLVRRGACPFECCIYREWVARGAIPVLDRPDGSGRVIAELPAGARFEAETGFVRVTSPQLVVVTRAVDAWRPDPQRPGAGQPARFEPGDTLLVLDYEGEGSYYVLRRSEVFSVPQFWSSGPGGPTIDPPSGEAIGEYRAEWWTRVRTSGGAEGWIDAYAAEIGNADACAE